jgi:hypothetical protein
MDDEHKIEKKKLLKEVVGLNQRCPKVATGVFLATGFEALNVDILKGNLVP